MKCWGCGAPLVPGALCGCGYDNAGRAGLIEVEFTLWEALCAWWRIWWPPHALLLVALVVVAQLTRSGRQWLGLALLLPLIFLLAEVLFIGRLTSRPYASFSLVILGGEDDPPRTRLTFSERLRIWYFLLWRQVAVAFLLEILLWIQWKIVGVPALIPAVLVIGPVLIKMLVGHQFRGFRVENR
jgi:hypothetical protein